MKDISKDAGLGLKVAAYLKQLGLDNSIPNKFNSQLIYDSIQNLLLGLGVNLNDESMAKTPSRVSRFFIEELFYGLDYNNFPSISFNLNKYRYHSPVISKNIAFNSTCEHHLVAIQGIAHIAYIPKDKVIGLSKINRVVDFFAKRPQVQERVTEQIFHTLAFILETEDIAVLINAKHGCITMRGVNDQNVSNTTYHLGGSFKANSSEFFSLVNE